MNTLSKWLLGTFFLIPGIVVPSWQPAAAQSSSQTDVATFPKYLVLGVVYAPPGSSSSVTYGNSKYVGASETISNGISNETVQVHQSHSGFSFLGFGSTTTNTSVNDFTSSYVNANTITVSSTSGNSISTMGPISSTLGVNHDNDVIYIMLNPVVMNTLSYMTLSDGSPMAFGSSVWDQLLTNGCDPTASNGTISLPQRMYGCDPNQYPYPDIIGIPVWCLKNPYYPGQGCAQWQQYVNRVWDKAYRGPASINQTNAYPMNPRNPARLTLQDFEDILKADPFIGPDDVSTNVCHPTYGPNFDPNGSEYQVNPIRRGPISNVLLTKPGYGYYGSTPTVTFSAPPLGGTTASGHVVMDTTGDSVAAIIIDNHGSGYVTSPNPPRVTISSPPNGYGQATAAAYLPENGPVDQIFVTNGGSGYTTAPQVTITPAAGAEGNGAVATALLGPNGSVVSVMVTNGGSGYTGAPIVTFSAPPAGGTQAQAVAYLAPIPEVCWGNQQLTSVYSRFQPYGTIAFPVPGPNGLPATYTGTFQYQNIQENQTTASDTHMSSTTTDHTSGFSLSVDAGYGIPGTGAGDDHTNGGISVNIQLAGIDFSNSSSNNTKTTFQNSTAISSTQTLTGSASYSITGPQLSDNYNGPATYNVYMDNVYGTFAFFSTLTPKVDASHIDVTAGAYPQPDPLRGIPASTPVMNQPIQPFPVTAVGSNVIVPVTLVNDSEYPMTMVFPAVTFSDPGFTIVEDGLHKDDCSNRYLVGQHQRNPPTNPTLTYYCTVYIQFAPTGDDRPSAMDATPAVNATMIAAGTLNVSSYQNILMTSHTPVYGIVSGTKGITLLPSGASFTQYNPAPYLYTFPNVSGITSAAWKQVDFILTNNYSEGVTIASDPSSWLKELNGYTGDFALLNNGCVGQPLSAGGTCTITVQFKPDGTNPLTGPYIATLDVTGHVGQSSQDVVLASAAMNGTATPVLTMSATMTEYQPDSLTYTMDSGQVQDIETEYTDVNQWTYTFIDATITVTNNGSDPVSGLSIDEEKANGSNYLVSHDTTTCLPTTTLNAGDSCTVHYPYSNNGPFGYNATYDWWQSLKVTGSTTGGQVPATIYIEFTKSWLTSSGCPPSQACNLAITFAPVTAQGSSQSVPAGNPAVFAFNLAPPSGVKTFPAVISFTATGLPPGSSVSFSPQTIAANSGAQTLTMTVQTVVPHAQVNPHSSRLEYAALLFWLAFPFACGARAKRMRGRIAQNMVMLLLAGGSFAAVAGTVGCASGGGTASTTAPTGPQTYKITVTAAMGKTQVSTNVSLTIQ